MDIKQKRIKRQFQLSSLISFHNIMLDSLPTINSQFFFWSQCPSCKYVAARAKLVCQLHFQNSNVTVLPCIKNSLSEWWLIWANQTFFFLLFWEFWGFYNDFLLNCNLDCFPPCFPTHFLAKSYGHDRERWGKQKWGHKEYWG